MRAYIRGGHWVVWNFQRSDHYTDRVQYKERSESKKQKNKNKNKKLNTGTTYTEVTELNE